MLVGGKIGKIMVNYQTDNNFTKPLILFNLRRGPLLKFSPTNKRAVNRNGLNGKLTGYLQHPSKPVLNLGNWLTVL